MQSSGKFLAKTGAYHMAKTPPKQPIRSTRSSSLAPVRSRFSNVDRYRPVLSNPAILILTNVRVFYIEYTISRLPANVFLLTAKLLSPKLIYIDVRTSNTRYLADMIDNFQVLLLLTEARLILQSGTYIFCVTNISKSTAFLLQGLVAY